MCLSVCLWCRSVETIHTLWSCDWSRWRFKMHTMLCCNVYYHEMRCNGISPSKNSSVYLCSVCLINCLEICLRPLASITIFFLFSKFSLQRWFHLRISALSTHTQSKLYKSLLRFSFSFYENKVSEIDREREREEKKIKYEEIYGDNEKSASFSMHGVFHCFAITIKHFF